MEMVSRMSYMDVGLDSVPPLSPELNLGTMNTSDMFDTGWDNSSGVESGTSGAGSNSSPYNDLGDGNLFLWDDAEHLDANLFQANLDNFGDEGDLLSLTVPFETDDLSFLQDSASNLSFASDISSSSSTITSYSIPRSPDHSIVMLEDESLISTQPISTSSPLKSSPEVKSCLRLPTPEPDTVQVTQNCSGEPASDVEVKKDNRQRIKDQSKSSKSHSQRKTSPKKSKKSQRSPLSPKLPQKSSDYISSVPISLGSDSAHEAKIHTKENNFTPSKKVVNILDSSVKWSELSDAEQRAVGEGIEMVLAQCIGVRERLDLMSLLEPDSVQSVPMKYDDMEWTVNLDDEKLDVLRRFLRSLDCNDGYHSYAEESSRKKIKASTKKGKKLMKEEDWRGFPKGKANIPLSKNHKQVWEVGNKSPLKKHLTNLQRPGSQTGKCWASLTKASVMKVSPTKAQKSKNSGKKCSTSDLQLRTRSRKEYRQLMKERRSGLFEKEEVVTLSTAAADLYNQSSKMVEEADEEDIDILG